MKLKSGRLALLLLSLGVAGLAAAQFAIPAGRSSATLRVGMIAGETLEWEVYQIGRLGLARGAGVTLEPVRLPGKAATEGALLAGDVDVIVDDWLWVARQRAHDERVSAVYPFSLATGAVVARADGLVRTLGDLRGLRLGVVSPTDKSWLLLRAACRKLAGFDPERQASVVMASPAALSKLLADNQVDAIVQYWQHVVRLVADPKFRVVMGVREMLEAVGAPGDVPLLVYVTRDQVLRERREALLAFLRAAREVKTRLAMQDSRFAQAGIGGSRLLDTGTPAVPARWRPGAPPPLTGWSKDAAAETAAVFDTLVQVGGIEMLGTDRLPPGTIRTEIAP